MFFLDVFTGVYVCVLLNWINSAGSSLVVEKSLPAVTFVLQLDTHTHTHTHTLTELSTTEYRVMVSDEGRRENVVEEK